MRNRIHATAVGILVFAITVMMPVAAQQPSRIVTIDAGMIEGAISGNVLSFKGIPYTAPPIGDRRWRSPQPVEP